MNHPQAATREELAGILDDMATAVLKYDDLEGFIEYTTPGPEDSVPQDTYAMVRAMYRCDDGFVRGWGSLGPLDKTDGDGDGIPAS